MFVRSESLLGRVLVEQAGEPLLGVVEQLRRLLIQHREPEQKKDAEDLMAQARAIIANLTVEDAYKVTKAFAIYFELTNLAETNHRKRRRRAAQLHADHAPLAGSFRGTLARLKAAGIDPRNRRSKPCEKIEVTPVFTAHPTEVARRTVLGKRRNIAALARGSRSSAAFTLGRRELGECKSCAQITALWQTDEVRLSKPSVTDEIRMGLDPYPMTLFDTVPRIYAEMVDSFREVYGLEFRRAGITPSAFLRFVDRRRS